MAGTALHTAFPTETRVLPSLLFSSSLSFVVTAALPKAGSFAGFPDEAEGRARLAAQAEPVESRAPEAQEPVGAEPEIGAAAGVGGLRAPGARSQTGVLDLVDQLGGNFGVVRALSFAR